MIKYIIFFFIFILLLTAPASARPSTQDLCESLSGLVGRVAIARDYYSINSREALYKLIDEGIPEKIALGIVDLVYLKGKDYTPEELVNFTQTMCESISI